MNDLEEENLNSTAKILDVRQDVTEVRDQNQSLTEESAEVRAEKRALDEDNFAL